MHVIQKKHCLSLSVYTLLGFTFLQDKDLHAQIILDDFEPDLRMMNWVDNELIKDTVALDIDSNSIDDLVFTFNLYESLAGSAQMKLFVNIYDAVTGILENTNLSIIDNYQFSEGDTINADFPVLHSGKQIFFQSFQVSDYGTISTHYGLFHSIRNYMGLQLQFDDETHYGWLRLKVLNVQDQDISYCNSTGSPLTISEFAYNPIPNGAIVCVSPVLHEKNSVKSLKFFDGTDANTVEDLHISFYAYTPLDFAELRIFLVPSREDVIVFSTEDALATPYYFSILAEDVAPDGLNTFQYTPDMRDIHGEYFSEDSYYSGFLMKMPVDGDTSFQTLTPPFNILKTELQRCILNVGDISMLYDPTMDVLHVEFSRDLDESDLSAYGAGMIWEEDYIDWSYYGLNYDDLDTVGIIAFPKTGDEYYNLDLPGVTHDIYGQAFVEGRTYYPVIFGFGDGYFRDLFCLKAGTQDIVLANEMHANIPLTLYTPEPGIIQVETPFFNSDVFNLKITNVWGAVIAQETINANTSTFSFRHLPSGTYLVSIMQNEQTVITKTFLVL